MDTIELEQLISRCLFDFHRRRIQAVERLRLNEFLRRKNPYLFRALAIERASEVVERLLAAHLSASDETIFGDAFFEPIAILVAGGTKSPTEGVDFFVEKQDRYLAVAVKSGPNIFNASQKRRQNQEFNALRARLLRIQKIYDPILGHAYGRYNGPPNNAKSYRDLSGQAFWEEITGDSEFYIKLITLMREEPLKYKDQFQIAWDAVINKFTMEFTNRFCSEDGHINWEALVQFVSSRDRPRTRRAGDRLRRRNH